MIAKRVTRMTEPKRDRLQPKKKRSGILPGMRLPQDETAESKRGMGCRKQVPDGAASRSESGTEGICPPSEELSYLKSFIPWNPTLGELMRGEEDWAWEDRARGTSLRLRACPDGIECTVRAGRSTGQAGPFGQEDDLHRVLMTALEKAFAGDDETPPCVFFLEMVRGIRSRETRLTLEQYMSGEDSADMLPLPLGIVVGRVGNEVYAWLRRLDPEYGDWEEQLGDDTPVEPGADARTAIRRLLAANADDVIDYLVELIVEKRKRLSAGRN